MLLALLTLGEVQKSTGPKPELRLAHLLGLCPWPLPTSISSIFPPQAQGVVWAVSTLNPVAESLILPCPSDPAESLIGFYAILAGVSEGHAAHGTEQEAGRKDTNTTPAPTEQELESQDLSCPKGNHPSIPCSEDSGYSQHTGQCSCARLCLSEGRVWKERLPGSWRKKNNLVEFMHSVCFRWMVGILRGGSGRPGWLPQLPIYIELRTP